MRKAKDIAIHEKRGIGDSTLSAALRLMQIGRDQKSDSVSHLRGGALLSDIIANSTGRFRLSELHRAGPARPSVTERIY